METPLFFKNNNYNLFAVIHEPDKNTAPLTPEPFSRKDIGIVFCSPFAEEKLASHRVMVNLARSLTEQGIYCLRFDYMGHGDSSGNFEDATIQTRISDIKQATEFLKKRTRVKKVGLIGVRFGATLATLSVPDNPIDFLILISPVIIGESYIGQCLRSNLTTQVAIYRKIIKDRNQLIEDLMSDQLINIDGYLLSKKLFQEVETINLLDKPVISNLTVLLLQISKKDTQVFEKKIQELYEHYQVGRNTVDLLNVTDNFFWIDNKIYSSHRKNISNSILKWLINMNGL